MIKITLGILLALSMSMSTLLFFKLVDAGLMLDNARSEVERQRQRSSFGLQVLRKTWLVDLSGSSKASCLCR